MLKNIIKKMLSVLPVRNIILMESIPDLSDNPVAVFREMISRGLNKKYRFIWIVSKDEKYPKIKNVSYCRRGSALFKIKLLYYRLFAKAVVCGNDFIVAIRGKQKTFYLSHGTAIKSVRSYYTVPENVNYLLVDGEGTREMMSYQFNKELEKTIALGYPRNDVLFNCKRDISGLFPEAAGQKIAVWYPTFRQHKNHSTADATKNTLPIIHNEAAAARLNEMAKANGVLIVLKPHFAQDVSRIKAQNLSNLVFIDDDFLVRNNIGSYEFVANCDALLTDYSSIYFDFLICNKPIGLVWEDFEEYRSTVNFAIDMERYMKAGEKIYTLDDFEIFLKNLAEGRDEFVAERKEISRWANFAADAGSSARVADFIIEKANL